MQEWLLARPYERKDVKWTCLARESLQSVTWLSVRSLPARACRLPGL